MQADNSLSTVTPFDEDTLTKELFASDLEKVEVLPWNDLVTEKWRDLTCKGLPAEQRDSLLKKYSPPKILTFLKASRVQIWIKEQRWETPGPLRRIQRPRRRKKQGHGGAIVNRRTALDLGRGGVN